MHYAIAALLAALTIATAPARADLLTHVHGLAYSADGKRLIIPSHHGLAIYENGKWSKAPGPEHDYMGFSATAKDIYSSGHPAAGSGLVNPFGLLRSKDGGKTWDKLGLEGESDFHVMATGWHTNAVYVWNPVPNSRMKQPGLHYTFNDGFVWNRASAQGIEGNPYAIAVHPDDPKSVALATPNGVFESSDAGESFAKIGPTQGTAVFFDLDGSHLWYGSYDTEPRLTRARLKGGPVAQFKLPPLTKDAVSFIAQNPARRDEYAIATFNRNVYISKDAGKTWTPIAERGEGK
ncbi:MAG: glycosyl hydrolase [Betaproteobacteria bacterium]|nr:MAG: glycosyl hydrolase [Betaproteobacteria bacterium]